MGDFNVGIAFWQLVTSFAFWQLVINGIVVSVGIIVGYLSLRLRTDVNTLIKDNKSLAERLTAVETDAADCHRNREAAVERANRLERDRQTEFERSEQLASELARLKLATSMAK